MIRLQLTAQRGLLLARERLLALQNQMRRLETRRFAKEPVPPLTKRMRGAIDLTSINVYLNRNFCIRNVDESMFWYLLEAFIVFIKYFMTMLVYYQIFPSLCQPISNFLDMNKFLSRCFVCLCHPPEN